MPDKPPPQAGDFFAIPGIAAISLEGRDAPAFAQAQFMNDVAALAPGHWQWNGWLTPKGRVVALFALLKLDAESLLLLLLDADPAGFASSLQRFVFRSKVAIRVREDLHATGRFAAPGGAAGARFAGGIDTGIELDFGASGGQRTLRIGTAADADAGAAAEWMRADLAHGLPRLEPSQAGQWTPQQLSLERLKAYSVKKGCYPGQEIVARTHFLGQAKRGLVRLRCDAGPWEGGDVVSEGVSIGRLACQAGPEALAVLPLEASPPAGGWTVGGKPCVPLPLSGGFDR